jgi:hypothetical protein
VLNLVLAPLLLSLTLEAFDAFRLAYQKDCLIHKKRCIVMIDNASADTGAAFSVVASGGLSALHLPFF